MAAAILAQKLLFQKDTFELQEQSTTMVGVGKRLIEIYMGQAVFRDWIQAEEINGQIPLLDDRDATLARVLAPRGPLDVVGVANMSQQILTLLYAAPGK